MAQHTWLTAPTLHKSQRLLCAYHYARLQGTEGTAARCFAGYYLERVAQDGSDRISSEKTWTDFYGNVRSVIGEMVYSENLITLEQVRETFNRPRDTKLEKLHKGCAKNGFKLIQRTSNYARCFFRHNVYFLPQAATVCPIISSLATALYDGDFSAAPAMHDRLLELNLPDVAWLYS